MGKNLIQQKRGKGSPTYRAPSFRYKGEIKYPKLNDNTIKGNIIDIIKCAGHSAPLIKIKYENGEETLMIAPEGVRVGDSSFVGSQAEIQAGSAMCLKNIPEGTFVYNIESKPGDGGKFARSSGTFAKVITKMENEILIRLPSSKEKAFNPECRATVGVVAGGGRLDKPFLKAGKKYYAKKAKNKLWPLVSGTSMNAVCHPFGGRSSHAKGVPTQSPRSAPPGAKVGKIAPKRTGRKKR